jgi:hypothetical protein
MADQSQSTRFRARFVSALQAYHQTTGISLAEHPLVVQLQNTNSVQFITTILKNEAQASSHLLGGDRIMNFLESTVSMLFSLSATTSLGSAIGLVRKAVLMACPGFPHP